ncbi:hypothetical protein KDK_33660 [Dictyobacter kobayashii]|uniref:Uncharacterized protein n=1 Tax=Dictyobacter kobayashii TaxID=2014872 RepID=A0A402AKK6_9CHLR|nr:hypothetical protein KDK_33640 [Dictyobacter kobayashii]GCE19566.1 hypothetical protein KDK_33660 [Dictyobacter kobayashii]
MHERPGTTVLRMRYGDCGLWDANDICYAGTAANRLEFLHELNQHRYVLQLGLQHGAR